MAGTTPILSRPLLTSLASQWCFATTSRTKGRDSDPLRRPPLPSPPPLGPTGVSPSRASVSPQATAERGGRAGGRYLQAREALQMMSSRFADVAGEILAFDMMPEFFEQGGGVRGGSEGGRTRKTDTLRAQRDLAVHLLSLLHALALQHAREDWDLGNLQVHVPDARLPPMNASRAPPLTVPGTGVSKLVGLDGFWTMFFLPAEQKRVERMNKRMPLPVIGGVSAEEQRLLWGSEWGGGWRRGQRRRRARG